MFEFIGICFVIFVAWRVAKRVLSLGVNKTLRRAVDFAVEHGVPRDFAVTIISNRSIMNEALNSLKGTKPSVSSLDVYQQYGLAIIMMHEGVKEEAPVENDDGHRDYIETKRIAVGMGVPSEKFDEIFTSNIDALREFAFQIDKPGEPHYNASFEVRMAVAVSMFYKMNQKARSV
ncbi:hypothetical protein [Pseudomonas putida]|uniref:hypothetical protein n=1 Tax=Pseudomonas putida TaxID=303 RepID=UPI00117AD3F9|nr:hypothetical protein [Pseudomonas putida]